MLALIILSGTFEAYAASNSPQFTLGDKLSIYSDKAYRKNNGRYFEAVGNVVIISEKDTVYGELASMDQDSMMVKVEGNVRLITKDMTLYGSHVEYNLGTGVATIRNARILTTTFNLVATNLVRLNEKEYVAEEAEFTTCRDCAESWSVYGKNIKVQMGEYVVIKHGLFKIKGIDVIYVPYIVLPIHTKRKTGLLIPRISSRRGEGLSFEQPIFWAIDDHKDMTFSPTFWAERGYGGDFQYRQRFDEMTWFETSNRLLNDTIYEPGKNNENKSGEEFFRYFTEVESHQFWSPNFVSHFRYTGVRDLEMMFDNPQFTDPKVLGSDLGLDGFLNYRQELYTIGGEGHYLRNQLFSDAIEFDRSYVQVMPRLHLNTVPFSLVQSRAPFLQHIAIGADSSFTRFRQVKEDDDLFIRNADRFSMRPYLMWHMFSWGPVGLKSRYTFDQQSYRFADRDEATFGKNSGIVQTEISFTMDRVFGLAYEEKIPLKYISEKDINILREGKQQGLAPIQQTVKESRLVGNIPEFETSLAKDNIVQIRNSYRHSQEFKFIHHYVASENEYGNRRFLQQIRASQQGQFDFEDSIRSEEYLFGANTTRTGIPPENTLEFQWRNTLIRKAPKGFSYLEDDKYLRDNFSYSRIGYFNLSQGYLLDNVEEDQDEDIRKRLTRLLLETGYTGNRWFINMQEYYFHYGSQNIFSVNFTRRFEYLNLFGNYTYNSFNASNLNTASFGGQIRPTDVLGVAMVRDMDLEAGTNIRTAYSVDIMPHNNCLILNLSYRDGINDSRYSFNILFNFGDEGFERYRNDYFGVKRI